MRNKSYYFDEDIAPLTEEEKQIMKEYQSLSRKVNKIYERTDQVIKLHKKTEKENNKKRQRQEEKESEKQIKKQKQEEELQLKQELFEKTECFVQNYTEFKKEFYKLFNQVKLLRSNFEDITCKVIQIKDLCKNFKDKCIHPESFKTIAYYSYEVDDGGGSGYGHSTYEKRECNACNICKSQDDKNKTFSWQFRRDDKNLEFSKYTDFDSEDNIKTLNKDINKVT